MEKRIWTRPIAVVEQFMANEYVAACWGISCDYGEGAGNNGRNDPFPNRNNSNKHRQQTEGNGCGWEHSQAITDRVNTPDVFSIIEINSPTGGGDLPCTLYTDGTYSTSMANISLDQLSNGMTLYWTNTWNGITWHHKGQVVMNDAHPGRS